MQFGAGPEISQPGRVVEEKPGDFEASGEVCGEGFDAEGLGRVMAAVEDVHAELFGERVSPVRPFAGDEGVHAFARGEFQLTPCAARDDADLLADVRSARQDDGCAADGALEAL